MANLTAQPGGRWGRIIALGAAAVLLTGASAPGLSGLVARYEHFT